MTLSDKSAKLETSSELGERSSTNPRGHVPGQPNSRLLSELGEQCSTNHRVEATARTSQPNSRSLSELGEQCSTNASEGDGAVQSAKLEITLRARRARLSQPQSGGDGTAAPVQVGEEIQTVGPGGSPLCPTKIPTNVQPLTKMAYKHNHVNTYAWKSVWQEHELSQ